VRADLVAEHVAVVLDGRADLLLHHAEQPLVPAGGVHAGRGILHLEQRVAVDRRRQPRVELLDRLGDREGRGRAAGRDALPVPLRQVVEVRRDGGELADHRLRDVHVGDGELGDVHPHTDLHAEDRVGAELRRPPVQQGGPAAGVPGHHRPGDPLLVVEDGLVEGVGAGREPPGLLRHGLLGLSGHHLEPVGVAVLPDHVRPGRRGAQPEVVVVLGQPVDLAVAGAHASPRTRADSSRSGVSVSPAA
jgi:hypothetical protein